MARQSDSILDAIKRANPIVPLVGEYLTLHRSGSTFKAVCPFHDDHNPSLTLNSEFQSYKCWSCGAGGDVIDFVKNYERIDFPEAVRMLAERGGIALEKHDAKASSPSGPSKADLLNVCAWAEGEFVRALRGSDEARSYIETRGISAESVERFKLGYAPDSRDWLTQRGRKAGFGLESMVAAGLVTRKEGSNLTRDRFRGRLIFPIHDLRSRPIAFGGRILPESEKKLTNDGLRVAKYLNSSETDLFKKRDTLYAADLARKAAKAAGWIGVVEGYTDVIAAHQAGLENVVAALGTALGDSHARALHSLADRVVLVLDGDAAGQNAVDRSLEFFLGQKLDVRVLTLPDDLDPADFLAERGAEAFRSLVQHAVDPLDFVLDRAAGRFDLHSPEGARQAAQWVLSILAKVPTTHRDGLDLKVAKALDTLSRRLGVPMIELNRQLRRDASAQADRQKRRAAEPAEPSSVSDRAEAPIDPKGLDPLEREIVEIALNQPEAAAVLHRNVPSDDLRDVHLSAILQACYDHLAEGQTPEFSGISPRLSDRERSLAAGLLLPYDPAPLPDEARPASWHDRLSGVLARLELRRWQDRHRDLQGALREIDPISQPVEHAALRAEYLKHLSRRPRP